MKQKSLFESNVNQDGEESFVVPKTRARTSHSDTSHQAAFQLDVKNSKHKTMIIVRAIVNRFGKDGITAYEIDELAVRLYDLMPEQARKRCSDCESAGLIQSGVKKHCPIRGSVCKTWWPVEGVKVG